ncbi:DUF1127 domain-containing protein [Pelagibacterium limicola]|uniref:DUF1127 domain-containing protein n=1 Tax=Pelagibacterium limicola TaxID=2791022 RepID=UPI0018B0083C|nr:DUF1127 domain-containing protein [Pelagibacterium limicola]
MAHFFPWARKGAGMRRSTLRELLNMDPALLSDIGLSRYDIADALQSGSNAGRLLAARRSARATEWLR